MFRLIRKEQGAALITVIIITAILTTLSVILLSSALQGLTLSKRQNNIKLTYFAGQSAIEKWFNIVQKESEDVDIGADFPDEVTAANVDTYVQKILDKVKLKLNDTEYIDVASKASTVAGLSGDDYSEIKLKSIEMIGAPQFLSGGKKVKVKLGIQAEASFDNPDNPYGNTLQPLYAEKDFIFEVVQNEFKLSFAIATAGDLYISTRNYDNEGYVIANAGVNNFSADIKGDVSAFGTFPKDTLWPEQFYYGGIMAMHGARMDVRGNAYSRAFIRTGPYRGVSESIEFEDRSQINVYRDAVAQCIQVFGNNNIISVFRNAYTFDDIEMNGEESIIAINGSAIGLSHNFASRNHDDLSAIISSAPVHNMLSDKSLMSTIAVNGDVIIPGGTFRVDDDGIFTGLLEDASVFWYEDTSSGIRIPFYKMYPWSEGDISDPDKYHKELRKKLDTLSSDLGGRFNLFQLWPSREPVNGIGDIETGGGLSDYVLGDFIDSIRAVWGRNKLPTGITAPTSVSGAWSYEIAANWGYYAAPLAEYGAVGTKAISYVKSDKFAIDNIYKKDDFGNLIGLKFDSGLWDDVPAIGDASYTHKVFSKLDTSGVIGDPDNIKNNLLDYTQLLANRKYPSSGSEWDISGEHGISKLIEKAKSKFSAYGDNEYYIKVNPSLSEGEYNLSYFYPDIYTECAASRSGGDFVSDTEYFLVFNEDPKIDLVIDGVFNGIILTAGSVTLHGGADIRGAIISGGGGTWSGGEYQPKLTRLDRDTSQARDLDRGRYAGVKIVPATSAAGNVKVDFYLGLTTEADVLEKDPSGSPYLNRAARNNLLDKFAEHDIYLYNIF
ncbi:hypothetical protein [Acetivibrio mesophilus]|uniref:Uncharacterized protein n=1 Tax=Acetivibrio mesophilus TaxID=2487273 RepID=A0A4Q0I7S9_9FIRM|nr:hypothetical protein [Acetivibrio mesophilus]ODM25063.1 hypothetical protein A7W90_01855 [Clostridium sp. Bc-iso-3]RXE59935.1 hypothetical protein EFD62_04065 [Acetivibrio mesophilus]